MIFELILIGLAITLEPIPLTAFILVLASKGGTRKGAGFIFGWLLSLAVVVALTLLVTGNNPPKPNTAPSLGILIAKILLGCWLVFWGYRAQQRRKDPTAPKKVKKTPKWQTGIDNMSPWFAVVLAPLVQPWGLVAAGIAVITGAKLSSTMSYVALVLFCLLAVSTYAAMEIYAVVRPAKTQAFLTSLRTWIDTHQDQVIVILALAVGIWLIANSAYLIVT